MSAYIEWLKRCVGGMSQMRSISSEGISMYGQTLLWQLLFLLTIVGTILAIGIITGGPFVGVIAAMVGIENRGIKKMTSQFPITVNKTSSKKFGWSFVPADQESSTKKTYLSSVRKMYGILLGFTGLLQFLFLPFGVTIGVEGNPVFCSVIGVIYWIITGFVFILEIASACSEQQSFLWGIVTSMFDLGDYYHNVIGKDYFNNVFTYRQDGDGRLIIYLYSKDNTETVILKENIADKIAEKVFKNIAGKTADEIQVLISETAEKVIG